MSDRRPTDKIILHESLQHPLTLFPTAVGLLGSLTTVLFGASTIVTGMAIGGLAVGAGSWAVNYFLRKDSFLRHHLMKLQAQSERKMKSVLKILETNLKNSAFQEDAKEHANQALQQFALIQQSFENFRQILSEKLDSKEITFNRFLMTGEQVNLAVLDNLQSVATRLKSISTIDPEYIQNRMMALQKLKKKERADEDEAKTLILRQTLRDEQMSKVNELLTYNEEALTQLAKANAAIVEMRGLGRGSSVELSEATGELEVIAKRAKNF